MAAPAITSFSTRFSPSPLYLPQIDSRMDTRTAALAYAEAGWYVLPVKRGAYKNPGSVVGLQWQHKSTRDPALIEKYFSQPNRGIALHVGRSGGIAFDLDAPAEAPPVLWNAICRDLPPYQSSRPDVPHKGHYLYATPPGRVIGNKLGKLAGGWGEVRGKNGVIIAAPSVHEKHEKGARYLIVKGGVLPVLPQELSLLLPECDGIEVDAASDAIISAFCAEHTQERAPGAFKGIVLANFQRKVDAGESRHTAMLATLCDAARDARAGLYPAERAFERLRECFTEVMAQHRVGSDRVLDPSAAESEFDAMMAYAVGAANAATPETVAARTARVTSPRGTATPADNVYPFPPQRSVAGLPQVELPTGNSDAMFDEDSPGQPIPEAVVIAQQQQALIEDSNAWLTPTPLEPAPDALDPSALGPIAGPMAVAVANTLQIPVDMTIAMAIPVIATAGRGRYMVKLSDDGAWVEPLILCSTAVLASGERKSASNSLLTKPLRDFENVVREEMGPELARQKGERKLEEGRLEALKKAALNGKSSGGGQQRQPPTREDEEAYLAAEQAMAARRMDFAARWIADDATPEAIAHLLNQQGGAIGIFSTEPGIFGILAGKYSAKGSPNLEIVLQATAGDPIHIDRKGDPDNPIHIEHPALSMTLAMQPGLLPQLSESGFRDSGLLARFLWVMPEPRVGTRNTDEVPMPPEVVNEWARAITALAKDALESTRPPPARYGEPESDVAPPRLLTLTPAAKAAFKHWRDWLEPRLHPRTGDLAEVADWGSKLPGQVAKIAMALTLLSNAKATEIQERAIADAITLGNGLVSHVKAVFAGIYSQSGTKDSRPREVLEWLVEQQQPRFTVKTVFEGLRGRVWAHRADAVKVALAALASDHHVRQVAVPVGPKGDGRPPSTS